MSFTENSVRNMNLEAAIWYLFASREFFEAAARESEATLEWFGKLAISKHVADFGRNNQIFDTFKTWTRDFRRGAELATLGDYEFIWDTARCVSGDVRGMMEQPLLSWMTKAEYREFSEVKINRMMSYARQITRVLNNAMTAAECFFDRDPDCPERADDDDGFAGEEIIKSFRSNIERFDNMLSWKLPEPLKEYIIDKSTSCMTGEEVPWTGVWYPDTGLERHSLTFAIKGLRMQPAFRIVKTKEELKSEGAYLPRSETVAVATLWHPVIPSLQPEERTRELLAKAGQLCPKAGIWQTQDVNASERNFKMNEAMANLGSAYGLTVWRWLRDG
ncbi:hypothetical protein GCM10027317_07400 [Massilia agri]